MNRIGCLKKVAFIASIGFSANCIASAPISLSEINTGFVDFSLDGGLSSDSRSTQYNLVAQTGSIPNYTVQTVPQIPLGDITELPVLSVETEIATATGDQTTSLSQLKFETRDDSQLGTMTMRLINHVSKFNGVGFSIDW